MYAVQGLVSRSWPCAVQALSQTMISMPGIDNAWLWLRTTFLVFDRTRQLSEETTRKRLV